MEPSPRKPSPQATNTRHRTRKHLGHTIRKSLARLARLNRVIADLTRSRELLDEAIAAADALPQAP